MSLPFSPSRRRAFQWLVVLLGVLLIAIVGVPRAIQPSAAAAPLAADGDPYPWLAPCSKLSAHRLLETAAPATQAPPTATPANPAPTATPRPAPQEDRVGFPAGYGETFRLLVVLDRPDNKQVRAICANEVAAAISPGKDFPYGSVLVMETWRARQDASGQPIVDANGRYIRQTLTGVFVMRKEKGFGTAYGPDRSGEWEYVAYRPDGTTMTAPARTNACASCHLRQAGAEADFVFRMDAYFNWPEALVPRELGDNQVNVFLYTFFPAKRTVKAGTTITWVNNDEAEHTVVTDGAFASDPLKTRLVKPGDHFSVTYVSPGTFPYFCSIHPAMKGVIEVTS